MKQYADKNGMTSQATYPRGKLYLSKETRNQQHMTLHHTLCAKARVLWLHQRGLAKKITRNLSFFKKDEPYAVQQDFGNDVNSPKIQRGALCHPLIDSGIYTGKLYFCTKENVNLTLLDLIVSFCSIPFCFRLVMICSHKLMHTHQLWSSCPWYTVVMLVNVFLRCFRKEIHTLWAIGKYHCLFALFHAQT